LNFGILDNEEIIGNTEYYLQEWGKLKPGIKNAAATGIIFVKRIVES